MAFYLICLARSSKIETVTADFSNLIDKWKAEHQNEGYDPLPFLARCSEILESALDEFHRGHPDPFDQRHPKLVVPKCRLGKLLTILENCNEFNDTMTSKYLKSNASPKNVGRVVIASAKLAFLAGKGYRIAGLDTEEFVNVLISWIIYANEPLRTYATGLIDGRCVVKNFSNDKSITLITILMKRLWNYLEPDTYKEAECVVFKDDLNQSNQRKRKHSKDIISEINSKVVVRNGEIAGKMWVHDLNNNSSSVEKPPAIPSVNYTLEKRLADALCQRYTLRLLKSFGELQEFLSTFYRCNVLSLISRYLSRKWEDRLVYNALEFLSTLLCHDKAATDFIELNEIQKLIDIPRHSMGSTGVALCLYSLACRKDAMEKICHSRAHILEKLIKYAIWLLECSHDSGKSHVASFFSVTFSYRNALSLFDDMNGLRYLVNMIRTTKCNVHDADDECNRLKDRDLRYSMSRMIKPACVALGKYFEAHVVFKVGELVQSRPVLKRKYPKFQFVTKYETATHTREQHFEYFDILRELSADECDDFNLDSWAPIALFRILDGVPLLLKIIENINEFEVTFAVQIEINQAALDVLCAVTLSLSCQTMLTECYRNLGLDRIGLYVIWGNMASFIDTEEATYMDGVCVNPALAVIANCTEITCTESRDDAESLKVQGTPSHSNKQRMVKETLWELIWHVDGVKTLLYLLDVTKPAQTADETRYLACKALVGLAEYVHANEILPKLHVLTNKLLNAIPKPVREDKKELHVKFCHNLELLLKRIVTRKAITLDAHWKTVLRPGTASETRPQYDNEDLLLMIYICLVFSGFRDNAAAVLREAGIFPDAVDFVFDMLKSVRKLEIGNAFLTADSKVSESNRSANPVAYDIITDEYLKHQHSKRQNPLFTVPQLSIFALHRPPKPSNNMESSVNIQKRQYRRHGVYRRRYGIGGTGHDLEMIYSRFRPVAEIRSAGYRMPRFTAVAFSHNDDYRLILGDSAGNFQFPKATKLEDRVMPGVFNSAIDRIEPSYAGDVILALSSRSWSPNCVLLALDNTFDVKLTFDDTVDVEFCKTVQDKIVATSTSNEAIIYDLNTGTAMDAFGKQQVDVTFPEDDPLCYYEKNRATFSYDDRCVLSDGCLWDVRHPDDLPIHRFDKFNNAISGVFHPNGLEVIINTAVWDMRNFKLIQTIPALDQCQLLFNHSRSVLYAVKLDTITRPGLMSAFRTFDSSNYNRLGLISVKQQVYALALDAWDRNVAVIETPSAEESSVSVCRMYEVGMALKDNEREE